MRTTNQAQQAFRRQLQKRFAELKTSHAGYSLRQLARDIDQKPAVLSQIFSGKRNVSQRMALKISVKLGLDGKSLDEMDSKFSIACGRVPIDLDQFELVAEWHHFAILSLATTSDFIGEACWIASRLGISKTLTNRALKRLEGLGLMLRSPDGNFVHSGIDVCTSDGVRNLAVRRRNEINLESARRSLYQNEIGSHDFTFMTLASTPKKMQAAKNKIRKFINELTQFLEDGERTEVYEFCTQFFPRTLLNQNNENEGDSK